ncbi:ABC transporter ATP-binding protein [Kribbella albertanoniae]|uniref:Fatty acid ABC transporter ATP-binding/permease protein n=1 Tax=Kribbella albertanoniae TaxID=1266829 RepID=A0A4R4Q8G5_9ACTN|nr:ABC transporter ATP-binding protein [Kribbella albertanoniae]TDC31282.1 ABC transporter ATP-binding protein [Kribbella albertanoniae]
MKADRKATAKPPTPSLFHAVRGRLLFGAGLSLVSSALGLLPYVAVAEIAKTLLTVDTPGRAVVGWLAVGVAGAAGRLGLLVAGNLLTHYVDADLQRQLRARLARHLSTVPLGWFSKKGSGELKKVLDDDIEDMHHLVAHAGLDVASAVGLPLAAIVYLVTVDWRMTLVTLALLPLAMLTISRAHRTLPVRMQQLVTAQQSINNATVEYVDGIQVIKAYRLTGRAWRRFSGAVDEFCDALAAWSAESGRALFASMALLSPAAVLVVVIGAGSAMISAGWLAPVDLLPFILVGVGLPAPYMTLVQGTQLLRKGKAAAGNVSAVLDEPSLPTVREPRMPSQWDIRFAAVDFGYDEHHQVLHHVDLHCPQGSVTALVGPSGSGKTTLTRLVPRFFDVTGGAIRIGEVDVRELAPGVLLRMVAVVFQDVVLVRDTIRENIRLGDPTAGDDEVEAAARAAQLHETILALPDGYDTVVTSRGGVLSGGERQRLTIARAILQDAPIVLLDEATASVDPDNEAAIQQALAELTKGRTLLVVAHRLHTIARADQIVVLDDGHVVGRGTHDELLNSAGKYARMWAAQYQLPRTEAAR